MKCKNDSGICGIGGYCVGCPALDMTAWDRIKNVVSGFFDHLRVVIWKVRGWLQ